MQKYNILNTVTCAALGIFLVFTFVHVNAQLKQLMLQQEISRREIVMATQFNRNTGEIIMRQADEISRLRHELEMQYLQNHLLESTLDELIKHEEEIKSKKPIKM